MNKEKIKELVEETFIENVMSNLDSALIFTYIQNLEQQFQKQKEVIDKAIEYIKYWWNIRKNQKMDFHIQSLLNILKEVDND